MCGIIGITGSPYAAKECYLGLMMLQHRGQDSAGIISFDEHSNTFHTERDMGHVKEAIREDRLQELNGSTAIAHNRYSTIGSKRNQEIQPMCMNYPYGIAMAHNGQVSNALTVRKELNQKYKRLLLSENDLELIMNVFAEGLLIQDIQEIDPNKVFKAVEHVHKIVEGGYSTVAVVANQGLLAFKDPFGIRPLCFGKKEGSYAFASESKTLEFLDYTEIEELKAGEMVYIDQENQVHRRINSTAQAKPCMFEWIYFSNADSTLWDINVYGIRLKLGQLLAAQMKGKKFDLVVPVPDTARPAAITLSEELGIPYREVLIKNRYAQRTFILNNQKDREKAVRLKLNVVKELVADKDILLVDDSIVRGTTAKHIIALLKDKGARSVTIASTCPELTSPCFYGIDFPDKKDLISALHNPSEIAKMTGAREVIFLSEENLRLAFNGKSTCMACINGDYPVAVEGEEFIKSRIEKNDHLSWIN
ncbi:MAG: amidophosphoribosyltransferase [Halobacteriovoraceae bacterium]|nr:amidophosphoribosyltransferase [Halobacteriovoraceae bacterium]|tara:strand:+ start:902 stop:2332 length:1431 start_codon:yes stop_codon:yes gene_type:complete